MASEKIKYTSVDHYHNSFEDDEKDVLDKIRETVQQAVPEAEGIISYNIPAFKFHGWLIYYSVYTKHFTLSFPPPWTVFEEFKAQLSTYKMSKSAVLLPKSKPIPYDLIADMVKFRAEDNIQIEKKQKKK